MTDKKKAPKAKTAAKPAPKPAQKPTKKTHAGFIAILGAPNAGKSTLLNRFIGQKVSIVSPKAQTTRIRTLGIMTEGDTQISFIDTPGIFAAKSRLDKAMVQAAWNSLSDADAVVLLIDATACKELSQSRLRPLAQSSRDQKNERITAIIDELKKKDQKAILVLNKIDDIEPARLLPIVAQLNETGIFSDTFLISALTGDGTDDLKKFLKKQMPESPWYYGEDQISDLPTQILAAELTREQVYMQLQQELPYAAAVMPQTLEEKRDGSVIIRQIIVVARENHRAIFLGQKGSRIKSIGEKARKDISRLLDRPVHLFLEVKIDEKWQDRPDFYRTFGLEYGKK